MKLSKDEKAAIRALEKVANSWPESLWLFSASGTLLVMKKENGYHAMTPQGGVDPDFEVGRIEIENDGGDWD